MAVDGPETIEFVMVGLNVTSMISDQPTKLMFGHLFRDEDWLCWWQSC
jgi:hypothetical protein